ncbi:MAG: hypothetical protein Kow00117_07910 [Phototrophicales bacterium]
MRKVFLLILFILSIVPVSAQDETIAELAASSGDFTYLVEALRAVDLVDTLNDDGPFTVFAPTDDAFQALLDTYNIEGRDLLADTDMLTEILTYHVVEGQALSADLSNGALETLGGESVQVRVEDGLVFVNGVTVVTPDLQASNGVIHVIDSVLLPPGVIPGMKTVEVTDTAETYFRVAHFSADAPPVDVYVDGELAVEFLSFGQVSEWFGTVAGTIEIAVTPAGSSLIAAVIPPTDVELGEDNWTTIAAVGTLENDNVEAAVFVEDVNDAPSGSVRATFFNAIVEQSITDAYADGQLLVESLRYPGNRGSDGAFTRSLPQGLYDFAITLEDAPSNVLFSLPDIPLTAGNHYLIAYLGSASDAFGVVVETVDAR